MPAFNNLTEENWLGCCPHVVRVCGLGYDEMPHDLVSFSNLLYLDLQRDVLLMLRCTNHPNYFIQTPKKSVMVTRSMTHQYELLICVDLQWNHGVNRHWD